MTEVTRTEAGSPVALHKPGRRTGIRTAFTLIELLVVIAIIGILAAMLMPALNKTKDRAVRLTDINNLKQLITATHLYTADNSDVLPWPNWLAGDGPNKKGWLYTIDGAASGPGRFKLETGLYWNTLANAKLYMCPADHPTAPLFKLRGQQISSYVMNGAAIGYLRILPSVKMSRISPNAIAFWETDESQPEFFNDGASYASEGVSARHGLGAIQASYNGAVNFVKFDDWYREAGTTNRSRLWAYPDSVNGR